MDLRLSPAVPDADTPRFYDHERILTHPTRAHWRISDIAFA
jgi:hypothetical protein